MLHRPPRQWATVLPPTGRISQVSRITDEVSALGGSIYTSIKARPSCCDGALDSAPRISSARGGGSIMSKCESSLTGIALISIVFWYMFHTCVYIVLLCWFPAAIIYSAAMSHSSIVAAGLFQEHRLADQAFVQPAMVMFLAPTCIVSAYEAIISASAYQLPPSLSSDRWPHGLYHDFQAIFFNPWNSMEKSAVWSAAWDETPVSFTFHAISMNVSSFYIQGPAIITISFRRFCHRRHRQW